MIPPYAENQPNNPALFQALNTNLYNINRRFGTPFFFTFARDYDPQNDANYFLNEYPRMPWELSGIGGVLTGSEVQRYITPETAIVEAGCLAITNTVDQQQLSVWLFNPKYRTEFSRIAELAINQIDEDGDYSDPPKSYWIEKNGGVWTNNQPWTLQLERQQLTDSELENLVNLTQDTTA